MHYYTTKLLIQRQRGYETIGGRGQLQKIARMTLAHLARCHAPSLGLCIGQKHGIVANGPPTYFVGLLDSRILQWLKNTYRIPNWPFIVGSHRVG